MKKNNVEEIQARRGFFKGASKGAMPVMTMLDIKTSAQLYGGSCNCEGGCSGCSGCSGTAERKSDSDSCKK